MMQPSKPPAQEPRFEPEIIPPGHVERSARRDDSYIHVHRIHRGHAVHRVYVGRVGPFTLLLLALAIAAVLAVLFFALLGAVLIWIPIVAMLVVGGVISGFLRR